MEAELDNWWNRIKNAPGDERKRLFVEYCTKLVELKDGGKLTEEEAAYKMVSAVQLNNLSDSSEFDAIFDTAATAELSRISSYAQSIGTWGEKTADRIKQKEWSELVAAVERAKRSLEKN